jgi:hypothetical protein
MIVSISRIHFPLSIIPNQIVIITLISKCLNSATFLKDPFAVCHDLHCILVTRHELVSVCSPAARWSLARLICNFLTRRWHVPPKRWFIYGLHGAITQKVAGNLLFTLRVQIYRSHGRNDAHQTIMFEICTQVQTVYMYKIWGFHDGDYEEWRLLGCYAAWLCMSRRFGGT